MGQVTVVSFTGEHYTGEVIVGVYSGNFDLRKLAKVLAFEVFGRDKTLDTSLADKLRRLLLTCDTEESMLTEFNKYSTHNNEFYSYYENINVTITRTRIQEETWSFQRILSFVKRHGASFRSHDNFSWGLVCCERDFESIQQGRNYTVIREIYRDVYDGRFFAVTHTHIGDGINAPLDHKHDKYFSVKEGTFDDRVWKDRE